MRKTKACFVTKAEEYLESLQGCFNHEILRKVELLAVSLGNAWKEGKQVFVCGNGGSAANALHLSNDLLYGIGMEDSGEQLPGIKVEALSANTAVLTCLSNDTGYENIFSTQLELKGSSGDLLIVLSGSGNSPNVVNAMRVAKKMGMDTCAITGFTGGQCHQLAEIGIHFPIEDMQQAEDLQLIIGHLCMQWLKANKPVKKGE